MQKYMTDLSLEQLRNRQRFFMAVSTLVLSPRPKINTFFLSASYSAMEMAIGQFLTFSDILWFDLNQIIKKLQTCPCNNLSGKPWQFFEKAAVLHWLLPFLLG